MTPPLLDRHLDGMLQSPVARDVSARDLAFRGLLSSEERQQDDGSGFGVMVWVTTLTVRAADITQLRVEDRVDVGPMRAPWQPPSARAAYTSYVVRKIGREDDFGARELVLADAGRGGH